MFVLTMEKSDIMYIYLSNLFRFTILSQMFNCLEYHTQTCTIILFHPKVCILNGKGKKMNIGYCSEVFLFKAGKVRPCGWWDMISVWDGTSAVIHYPKRERKKRKKRQSWISSSHISKDVIFSHLKEVQIWVLFI